MQDANSVVSKFAEHAPGEVRFMTRYERRVAGHSRSDVLNPSVVDGAHRLANAAKAGRWAAVFDLLESKEVQNADQSTIGGTSWFTPLHQAAWLGAPSA